MCWCVFTVNMCVEQREGCEVALLPCLPSFNATILSYFLFTYSHRKPASKCWADDVEAQGVYRHCNDSALARCQGVHACFEIESARARAGKRERKQERVGDRERAHDRKRVTKREGNRRERDTHIHAQAHAARTHVYTHTHTHTHTH